jgi:hypothetical protein
LEEEITLHPSAQTGDGFYAARLVRTQDAPSPPVQSEK